MLIDIEVQDVKHLARIITALRVSNTINSVQRARGQPENENIPDTSRPALF